MDNINKIVSMNLVKFRTLSGMTQSELAKKINYSDKSISKWENGDSLPDFSVFVKLSEIYNVKLDDFIQTESREEKIKIEGEFIKKERILISILLSGFIFFLATISFVIMFLIKEVEPYAWLSFVYAVPISAIILLVLSKLWWNNLLCAIFSSIVLWGVVLSVCLTIYISDIWVICAIGFALEILIIFWFILKKNNESKNII